MKKNRWFWHKDHWGEWQVVRIGEDLKVWVAGNDEPSFYWEWDDLSHEIMPPEESPNP